MVPVAAPHCRRSRDNVATAWAVFSAVVEALHGSRVPQARHGRIEEQTRRSSISTIAVASCGSAKGTLRPARGHRCPAAERRHESTRCVQPHPWYIDPLGYLGEQQDIAAHRRDVGKVPLIPATLQSPCPDAHDQSLMDMTSSHLPNPPNANPKVSGLSPACGHPFSGRLNDVRRSAATTHGHSSCPARVWRDLRRLSPRPAPWALRDRDGFEGVARSVLAWQR